MDVAAAGTILSYAIGADERDVNSQQENFGMVASMGLSQIIGLFLSGLAAYLCWNKNGGANTVWRIMMTIFAFIFGGSHLMYYLTRYKIYPLTDKLVLANESQKSPYDSAWGSLEAIREGKSGQSVSIGGLGPVII